jgi:glycosyltransferase involved in cell wall biosynthesis
MLSILIPVYNFNIVPLVGELHRQATMADIPFEIIVLDDFSSALLRDQNKEVENLSGVKFNVLDKNIGRARIRNRLATMANYSTLLFMDCDSEVPSEQYIRNYLPYCDKEVVVCGGRSYRSEPPEEQEYLLRWLYGVKKEQVSEFIRNINPYRSFMTNNFLVPKSVFLKLQFDESLIQYGHEDTLFGIGLKKNGIPVKHIKNPLIHIGLEMAREYLRKTDEGIVNLVTLVHHGKISQHDFNDIRLLHAYEIMRKYRLVGLFYFFCGFAMNAVTRNLLGSNPSIFAFDLHKLSYLSHLIRKKSILPLLSRT